MSKNHNYHNYSNYSNNHADESKTETVETPQVTVTAPVNEDDWEVATVVTPDEPETITNEPTPEVKVLGTTNHKLNIRKSPDEYGEILTVVPKGTVLEVNAEDSTDEWLSIVTPSGVEGWCMAEFVDLK